MEGFVVVMMFLFVFAFGCVVGNINSTNDISQKEIVEAGKLCESSEGLYKINKGSKEVLAYCKNNDVFTLKDEKK